MSVQWPRVMPALVTAFSARGDIDIDAHLVNVGVAVDAGANGVLIGGSTGEGPYLEPGERLRLLQAARVEHEDLITICGVFAESVRQAGRQIDEAHNGQANAVLVVTPTSLVRGRHDLVEEYYEAVADLAPCPVFLYTVPKVTGYELPCASVARLAGHPNIVGMKDSGGDTSRLSDLSAIMDDCFIVYAGSSRVLTESVEKGAYGAITASANYAFGTVSDAVTGDIEAQQRLIELTSAIEPNGIPGTKHAASLTGMTPGHSRRPLGPLTESHKTKIHQVLRGS